MKWDKGLYLNLFKKDLNKYLILILNEYKSERDIEKNFLFHCYKWIAGQFW